MSDETFEAKIAKVSDEDLVDIWTSVPNRSASTPEEIAMLDEMERRNSWSLNRIANAARG